MTKLGVNRDNQKRTNRGLILQLVATGQCSSRIELARTTGLTKTAVSQIVAELMARDLLVETQKEQTAELGRNPVGLAVSPGAPRFVGVVIQRSYCEAVLCDMNLKILKSQKIFKEWETADELMENVYLLVDNMLQGETLAAGIGVAAIGPVSVTEGRIVHPLYFRNIENLEVRRLLEERYCLPVSFDHDNQSAALAEYLYGNGRNYQDILLVSVARGVGCGIMVQGKRMHSYNGYAPEIGHVSIDHRGNRCICGNRGCLETYINSDTVLGRFREVSGKNYDYYRFLGMTDEPEIDAVMNETVDLLASALVSVVNILNSQIILLGLDCCFWPDKYVRRIEQEINRLKFGNIGQTLPVKKACFLSQTQVLGAACNAISRIFAGELPE